LNDIKSQKNNRTLLRQFNNKSKTDITKISSNLNLGTLTIKNRLSQLKEEKIISNITININPNPPLNLKYVFLEIKTNPKEPQLVNNLIKIPQIRTLDGIFGEFSLIGLFIFRNLEEYHEVLSVIDVIMAQSYFKKYQIIEPIKVFKTNGIELQNALINPKVKLDYVDYDILSILQENYSLKYLSTYKIKAILNEKYKKDPERKEISQPTIYNHIKKLESERILLNYTLNFNPKKIGFKGKYIVRIKPKDPSRYNDLAVKLEKKKEITDLFRIGEQYGLFAIVQVREIEDYGKFIRELYDTEEIEDTFTNFILDSLIPYTNFIIH